MKLIFLNPSKTQFVQTHFKAPGSAEPEIDDEVHVADGQMQDEVDEGRHEQTIYEVRMERAWKMIKSFFWDLLYSLLVWKLARYLKKKAWFFKGIFILED